MKPRRTCSEKLNRAIGVVNSKIEQSFVHFSVSVRRIPSHRPRIPSDVRDGRFKLRSSPRDKAKSDAHLPTVLKLGTSCQRQSNGTWPEEGVVVLDATGCSATRCYHQPCATKGHAGDELKVLERAVCA